MSSDHGTLPDIPHAFEGNMKAAMWNGILFLVGIIGTPIAVYQWQERSTTAWLVAVVILATCLVLGLGRTVFEKTRKRRRKFIPRRSNGE